MPPLFLLVGQNVALDDGGVFFDANIYSEQLKNTKSHAAIWAHEEAFLLSVLFTYVLELICTRSSKS